MAAAISLGAPEWAHGAAKPGRGIGPIFVAIMSSSSVTSAFHGGGVGAGVRHGAGAIHTDTDIMALATRTGTAMDTTAATGTGTATPATVMDTATAAGPEWPGYSAGSLAPVITAGPLTAS